ncbi:MAG: CRTAC1 family protein [Acidobacteriota bacterium]|nr:MAG: CRTAC1 family protein [Acidobacteriota bacterium]
MMVDPVTRRSKWTFLILFLILGRGVLGSGDISFVDVTESAGITFSHHSSPEKKYIVEVMAGGVAFFDYDNDGWLDLFLLNSLTVESATRPEIAKSHLYKNNRDGTFVDVTDESGLAFPGWGMGVAAGDFDSDGWLDLYVTCLGPNRLYRNNGDGTFTDVGEKAGVTDPRWSVGAAFGDSDRDGDLDLFVSNYLDFSLDNLPTFGEGKWCQHRGIPVHCGPRGLKGAGDSLFQNQGDGTFKEVSESARVADPDERYGLGVVWADLNDDEFLDLFVVNDTGANYFYVNQKDGTFEDLGLFSGAAVNESGMAQGCMGIAVGDYDHDGKLDFYVTNFGDEYNALYRKLGPGTFLDTSFASLTPKSSLEHVGWGTGFVDFDNDGWVDIFVANGHVYPQVDFADVSAQYRQPKLLFRNNGNGTFADISTVSGEALTVRQASRGAAFGDYDNDGDIDIVVNNLDGSPLLLRNDRTNGNNWIRIQLVAAGNDRFAMGAHLRIVSGDLIQVSEVFSGGSYASQSDLRQHFGLGERTEVDAIEVRWTSGKQTLLENVSVNQDLVIKEASD